MPDPVPATAAHSMFRTNDGMRCFTDCPACRAERMGDFVTGGSCSYAQPEWYCTERAGHAGPHRGEGQT